MKLAFSTLGCPHWELERIAQAARAYGYAAVELRAIGGDLDLLKRAEFQTGTLETTRRWLADQNLSICCVDTSCTFDSRDADERRKQVETALKHAELAAALGAPLIRIFPDKIQTGATRSETRDNIAASLHDVAEHAPSGVSIALETHGDFARGHIAAEIVRLANHPNVVLIWDVANSVAAGDSIEESARAVAPYLAHVHLRDARAVTGHEHWLPVLAGRGAISFADAVNALRRLGYDGYVSFEWEKYWHPEIEEPEVALPDFVEAMKEIFQGGAADERIIVDPSIEETHGSARPRVVVLASDVLFSHFFPEGARARLSEVAEWSQHAGRDDSSQLRAQIAQADVLMTTWHSPFLRMEMFETPPRVRLIAHCGGEVKSRMEEEVFDHITVTNAAEPMAAPVAEMALALMLTLVRRLPNYATEMRAGMIRTNEYISCGETVRGRKVGLIGFGRIGRAFARLIQPLGVELFVTDPCCTAETAAAHKGKLSGLDELLSSCSVIVLAAGLTPETRNLLDQRRLGLMPDGAYLINVARGGLVDMDALLAELRKGGLTAALDVTDPLEPLPPDHELRRLPNALLTPHIAGGGIELRRAMGAVAVEEVVRFCNGEPLQNVVTREMLAMMT